MNAIEAKKLAQDSKTDEQKFVDSVLKEISNQATKGRFFLRMLFSNPNSHRYDLFKIENILIQLGYKVNVSTYEFAGWDHGQPDYEMKVHWEA